MRKKRSGKTARLLALALAGMQITAYGRMETVTAAQGESAAQEGLLTQEDLFSDRDLSGTYEEAEAISIQFTEEGAGCSDASVQVDGQTVTITAEGTYLLSGTAQDGSVIVDADKSDKVQLVLNGLNLTSQTSAAIYCKKADKVFLTLAPDTENYLANGGEYTAIDDNNIDAVIFSKTDLTLNGSGTLVIEAAAGHGVVSKDDLKVTGGTYQVQAASHGLSGKDRVCVAAGQLTITAGKDGIHSENNDDETLGSIYLLDGTYEITSDGDCISAAQEVQISAGEFTLTAGGGSASSTNSHTGDWGRFFGQSSAAEDTVSTKGIKAEGSMQISSGVFSMDTADDCLHCGGDLTISGGTFTLSSGDDGVHADAALVITDGQMEVLTSYEGLEGMSIEVSGGNLTLNSSDDGMNAAGGTDSSGFGGFWGGFEADDSCYITISGGTVQIDAQGDGIDSNGSILVSGGEVWINGPSDSANGAIDCGTSATVTGGVVAALGASGMAVNFGQDSTQGSIMLSTQTQEAGTKIEVLDENGEVLLSGESSKSFSNIVVSAPQIEDGKTYTIKIGENETTVTMDGLIYGGSSGMFGGGGGGRMGGGTGGGGRMGGGQRDGGQTGSGQTDSRAGSSSQEL